MGNTSDTQRAARTLSKSDFILGRTCEAKLYYRENGFPDNRGYSPYLQLLANGGYMVEALARTRFPDGIMLASSGQLADDVALTQEYMARDSVVLFQPTFAWQRRVARIDILQKVGNEVRIIEVKAKSFDGDAHAKDITAGGRGEFWTSRKPQRIVPDWEEKFADLAYQTILVERALPGTTVRPYLLLVDKSKRSRIDSLPQLFALQTSEREGVRARTWGAEFIGSREQVESVDVLTLVDAAREVEELRAVVEEQAARLESRLDAEFDPTLAKLGTKCAECEFRTEPAGASGFAHCWGELASVTPHALELYRIGSVKHESGSPLIEVLARDRKVSLFDIPVDKLRRKDGTVGPQAAFQIRQINQTHSGEFWLAPTLATKLTQLQYPLHFIDFEVTRLALPYHADMRPYGQVAFQWSCHTVDAPGAVPRHTEWLNSQDEWPNIRFAQTLRDVIGDSSSVLVWSAFEGSRLNELAREHTHFGKYDAALVDWVNTLVGARFFDLHDCARDDFYHPGMRGSTSIKVVLDALWRSDAAMREQFSRWTDTACSAEQDPYHALPALMIDGVLQDVREGTGAMRAYEAMLYGTERNDTATRDKWRALLLQYCKLDTLSMVLIFEHWKRIAGVS